jgi:hypothetical protein
MLRNPLCQDGTARGAAGEGNQNGACSSLEDFHRRIVAGLTNRHRAVAQRRREIIAYSFDKGATAAVPADKRPDLEPTFTFRTEICIVVP